MRAEACLDELLAVIKKLRSKAGCPWSREQTHESLIPYLEEESSEVIDAIYEADSDHLKEELADLLLQVLLHSEIAAEAGDFDFNDVLMTLKEKMIRRHPHVFSGKKYESIEAHEADWQEIKKAERKAKGLPEHSSILSGIPKAFPALKQATILQEKAAKVGFDWDAIEDVWAKVEEEQMELHEAVKIGNIAEIKGELGDLFFSLVNLSRFLEVDATEALNMTNLKFRRRFQYIEVYAEKSLTTLTLEELDRYWDQAKVQEMNIVKEMRDV